MRPTLAIASLLLTVAACGRRVETGSSIPNTADVRTAAGASAGTLAFHTTSAGLHIIGTLTGLPAGTHGIHLHQVGRCDAPEFTTAGSHLNPAGKQHGLQNAAGPHAGDLPNVTVTAGEARIDVTTTRTMMGELLDADGSAIVVHAAADDQRTDPGGNSGARIACGVVR